MKPNNYKHRLQPHTIFYDALRNAQREEDTRFNPAIAMYKGTVIDNEDPENRGRIKVRVAFFDDHPTTPEQDLQWFVPVSVGNVFYLPAVGDMVWVSYEDIKHRIGPVWYGHFMKTQEWPLTSDKQILIKTKDDSDGGNAILLDGEKGSANITADQIFVGNAGENLRDYIDSELDEIKSMLGSIKTQYNSHMHSNGNLGAPTGTPIIPLIDGWSTRISSLKSKVKKFLTGES